MNIRIRSLKNHFNQTEAILGRGLLAIAGFITLAAAVTSASAQVRTTYISAVSGSDANACTRTAPCREINRALSVISSGGTVLILDTGEYAPFTVSKSANVAADRGVTAMVIGGSSSNYGAYVSGTSSISVTLRGLDFSGSASGIVTSGQVGSLTVEDCSVEAALYGIWINTAGTHFVKNTKVRNALYGVVFSASSDLTATVTDTDIRKITTVGLWAGENARVTARNTVVSNAADGFVSSHTAARLVIEDCVSTNNSEDGISVSAGWARVSNTTIVNNEGFGIRVTSGSIKSFGNNRITHNTAGSFSGTVGPLSQQ